MTAELSLSQQPRAALLASLRGGELPPHRIFGDLQQFQAIHGDPAVQEALLQWLEKSPEAARWLASSSWISRILVAGQPLGVWAVRHHPEALAPMLQNADTWTRPNLLHGLLQEERAAKLVLSTPALRRRLQPADLAVIEQEHPRVLAEAREEEAEAREVEEEQKIEQAERMGEPREQHGRRQAPASPERASAASAEEGKDKKDASAAAAATSPRKTEAAPPREEAPVAGTPEWHRWAQATETPMFDPSAEGSALERLHELQTEIRANFDYLDLPNPAGDHQLAGTQARSLLGSQDASGNQWRAMLTQEGGLVLSGATLGAGRAWSAAQFERVGLRPSRIEQVLVPLLAEARARRLRGEEPQVPTAEGPQAGIDPAREESLRTWWSTGANQQEAESMRRRASSVGWVQEAHRRGDHQAILEGISRDPEIARWAATQPELREVPLLAERLTGDGRELATEPAGPTSLSSFARLQRMLSEASHPVASRQELALEPAAVAAPAPARVAAARR